MERMNAHSLLNGTVRLPHLGVIELAGEDAVKFIHGQLTHDFALLGADRARLAALCSAKGRMLASFIGIKAEPNRILLICSADQLAAMLKRLTMFVLRAKVKLRDATADFALWGLAGAAADAGLSAKPVWSVAQAEGGFRIRLYPADGVERQMAISLAANSEAPAMPPHIGDTSLTLEAWHWGEVLSGVATVTAPISEQFVPQMLNYESVDGVNFKKGCYPGQEVVARSQFRGTLKRRAFVVQAGGPLAAGDEVFLENDADQPVGMVAQAAAVPTGDGWKAIVSLQLSALPPADGSGELHAKAPNGPALKVLPLPYPLLEDI